MKQKQTEPNLQNIHPHTEEGEHIRKALTPGRSILTADYSELERRILASNMVDEEACCGHKSR